MAIDQPDIRWKSVELPNADEPHWCQTEKHADVLRFAKHRETLYVNGQKVTDWKSCEECHDEMVRIYLEDETPEAVNG